MNANTVHRDKHRHTYTDTHTHIIYTHTAGADTDSTRNDVYVCVVHNHSQERK